MSTSMHKFSLLPAIDKSEFLLNKEVLLVETSDERTSMKGLISGYIQLLSNSVLQHPKVLLNYTPSCLTLDKFPSTNNANNAKPIRHRCKDGNLYHKATHTAEYSQDWCNYRWLETFNALGETKHYTFYWCDIIEFIYGSVNHFAKKIAIDLVQCDFVFVFPKNFLDQVDDHFEDLN